MGSANSNLQDQETAYAKINLALHLRERRADGYHQLETLFAYVDDGDILSAAPAEEISLAISGPFAAGLSNEENLVLDAAHLLADHAGIDRGAALTLDKYLPIASGIGGGSADAAAALRMLNRFWGINYSLEQLAQLSAPLGADVPACVISQLRRGAGIGHDIELEESNEFTGLWVLLANPRQPLSTGAVFRAWDGEDRGALPAQLTMQAVRKCRNDLEPPAKKIMPIINEVLELLIETNPLLARMSGSGATCFALYRGSEEVQQAERVLTEQMRDLWTMAGVLR